MVSAGGEIYDEMGEALSEPAAQTKWGVLKTNGPKVFGLLLYGAAAGYLIYSICEDAKNPDITPGKIVQDVGLGLISLGLLVKGAQLLMSLGVGEWMRVQSLARPGFLGQAAGAMAAWFTEGGVKPEGPLGRALVTVLGENYSEFFAKRLGPAMAILGIAMASFWLYEAIVSHDVRDIVFQTLSLVFALADAVFIGLELMSFAWAGPVGLAIAAVGLLVALVQLIWNLADPPKPPADAIEQFVGGPMKDAGFAT
jgi:hypothetical protein